MATTSAHHEHAQSRDNSRMHNGNNYNYTTNNNGFYNVPNKPPGDHVHTDLIRASAEGARTPRLRYLLSQGANIDHKDGIGCTPLHHAVFSGSLETIRAVVQAGADVNAVNEWFGTPLCLAALRGDREVVELLIKDNAHVNKDCGRLGSAAHAACSQDDLKIVTALHAAGAVWDVERSICAMSFYILEGMASRGECLQAYYTRSDMCACQVQSPGAMAVDTRNHEAADFCLSLPKGLSINETWKMPHSQSGRFLEEHTGEVTLLGLAMSTLDYKTAGSLLRHGADARALDTSGRGALIYALGPLASQPLEFSTSLPRNSLENCVRLLLEHGVDINEQHKRIDIQPLGAAYTRGTYVGFGGSYLDDLLLFEPIHCLEEGHETAVMHVVRTATDPSACLACIHVLCGNGAKADIREDDGRMMGLLATMWLDSGGWGEVYGALSQYTIGARTEEIGSKMRVALPRYEKWPPGVLVRKM